MHIDRARSPYSIKILISKDFVVSYRPILHMESKVGAVAIRSMTNYVQYDISII